MGKLSFRYEFQQWSNDSKQLASPGMDSRELEYATSFQAAESAQEKAVILKNYTTILKDELTQTIHNVRQAIYDKRATQNIARATRNETDSNVVTEHQLVSEGLLTQREADWIPYEILNTYATLNTIDLQREVGRLFRAARYYYSELKGGTKRGMEELGSLSYTQCFTLIQPKILELLERKKITFEDIRYLDNNEINALYTTINRTLYSREKYSFIGHIINGGLISTLQRFVDANASSNEATKEELRLIYAFLTNNTDVIESSKQNGVKLYSYLNNLTLALYYNDCLPFSNIIPLVPFLTDVNVPNLDQDTLLSLAIKNNNIELIKSLINYHHQTIDINARSRDGKSALLNAIIENNIEIIKALLSHPNLEINNLLFTYVTNKDGTEIGELFLNHPNFDINVNIVNAIHGQNMKLLYFLFYHPSFDINFVFKTVIRMLDSLSDSYFTWANKQEMSNFGNDVVRLLFFRHDFDINIQDEDGVPLIIRTLKVSKNMFSLLVEHPNFDVNITVNSLISCANHVIGDTNVASLAYDLIFHSNFSPNIQDTQGNTPLINGIKIGNEEIVLYLLLHPDIDLNIANREGFTPLIQAVILGYTNIVKRLIGYQDEVNTDFVELESYDNNIRSKKYPNALKKEEDSDGDMFEYITVTTTDTYITETDKEIDPFELFNNFQETRIEEYNDGFGPFIAPLKVPIKININMQDQQGQTALMHAVINCRQDIIAALLSIKDINLALKDNQGNTTLMYAEMTAKREIIEACYNYQILQEHETTISSFDFVDNHDNTTRYTELTALVIEATDTNY